MDSKRLCDILNNIAPFSTSCEWDNCGAILDCGNNFDRVLFALDATADSIALAQQLKCGAIVSHHPAIFGQGLKKITSKDVVAIAAMKQISLFAVHTCWDAANGGVNDVLCQKLGILDVQKLDLGRIGTLNMKNAAMLAEHVKKTINARCVTFVDGKKPITKVAVIGGAGGDYIETALLAGCDALVTGEIKHHEMLLARQLGITVICAGHFATEVISIEALRRAVQHKAEDELECILFGDEPDPICVI